MINSKNALRKIPDFNQRFKSKERDLSISCQDFWCWAFSDLLNNTTRGILAEFLIANALRIDQTCRKEWNAYDLITEKGLKIEVKSAAYVQSWEQKKVSEIKFNIATTKGWDAETNTYSPTSQRQSDVYIFALLKHKDKNTVNPLDLDQWLFYVLKTAEINKVCGDKKSIGINSLLKLNPAICHYDELKKQIESLEQE
ncbi:MAG: hypothetical protein ACK4ND_13580 [Cytophagaceae bacterium]